LRNVPLSPATPGATPLDILPHDDAMLSTAESFGERLARLRKAAGFTQGDLADRLGVSMTSVCYWEQDRSRPKHARIKGLAAALDVDEAELLAPARAPSAPHDFQHLVARARTEIAHAAGIEPAKVKIVIEI